MDESFRKVFIVKMLKTLETEAQFVKPMEVGILHERYGKMYRDTPAELRPRIFEQLTLSLLLWATASDKIHPSDDVKFVQFVSQCKRVLSKLVIEYNTACKPCV
jgi:hypothetical protein